LIDESAALQSVANGHQEAVRLIGEKINPGMSEAEARDLARATLAQLGSPEGWHKILIRFGPNTIKDFPEPSDRTVRACGRTIFSSSISVRSGMGPRATAVALL
jgi:hypothetical protein